MEDRVLVYAMFPLPPQVEGLKGVLFANQKNPRSRFGASVVSYDKGGRWDSITPPSVDLNGRIINCAPVGGLCQ